jgi:putative inorganic carbon (HCO3(-)) transporter
VSRPVRGWWRPEAAGSETAESSPSSPVAFGALMAFTFILLFGPQEYITVLRDIRVAFLAAAAGILAELVHRIVHHRRLLAPGPELRLVLALVAWSVFTAPFSLWPGGSINFLLDRYLKTVAIFWLLVSTVDTVARLRQVAWMLAVAAVPLSLTAVRNFVSGAFIELAPGRIVGYSAPLTENPNDLALMLNLVLPLAVGLLLSPRRVVGRILLVAAVALAVVGVVVTFSRAGLLTLLAILGVYLFKLLRRGRAGWAFIGLVLMLAALPLLPPGYTARLVTITSPESDPTGSAQERWSDMMVAARLVLTHPVGAGLGTNRLALNQERGATWRPIHNVYLEYGVELGVPGLMLFLMLLVNCFKKARAVERGARDIPGLEELFPLASGIHVSLIAFALAALFHPVGYEFYFYYLGGLAVGAHNIYLRVAGGRPAQVSTAARTRLGATPTAGLRVAEPGRST